MYKLYGAYQTPSCSCYNHRSNDWGDIVWSFCICLFACPSRYSCWGMVTNLFYVLYSVLRPTTIPLKFKSRNCWFHECFSLDFHIVGCLFSIWSGTHTVRRLLRTGRWGWAFQYRLTSLCSNIVLNVQCQRFPRNCQLLGEMTVSDDYISNSISVSVGFLGVTNFNLLLANDTDKPGNAVFKLSRFFSVLSTMRWV